MIAVAVCTHNPDEELLGRTLEAIAAQDLAPLECVIIDNNSNPPVASLGVMATFLRRMPSVRVVREERQGLTFARIAAIEATRAPLLCFVDDDNEPASDYLRVATRVLAANPCIGALGPGRVTVDYVEAVPKWFSAHYSWHFQERDRAGLVYACVPATWTDYYPPGSCLVVRREVLEAYREGVLGGQLSATDRLGRALSSGGDTQIVWEAVKLGVAAGISGELRIRHVVPGRRATLGYIRRLSYGTASSYLPTLVSSFPEERSRYVGTVPSNTRIVRTAMKIVARHLLKGRARFLPIELAAFFGRLTGTLKATGDERRWIDRCVKLLNLA